MCLVIGEALAEGTYFYLDGVLVASALGATGSIYAYDGDIKLARFDQSSPPTVRTGFVRMNELRVSSGGILYPGPFTPPTGKFPDT